MCCLFSEYRCCSDMVVFPDVTFFCIVGFAIRSCFISHGATMESQQTIDIYTSHHRMDDGAAQRAPCAEVSQDSCTRMVCHLAWHCSMGRSSYIAHLGTPTQPSSQHPASWWTTWHASCIWGLLSALGSSGAPSYGLQRQRWPLTIAPSSAVHTTSLEVLAHLATLCHSGCNINFTWTFFVLFSGA